LSEIEFVYESDGEVADYKRINLSLIPERVEAVIYLLNHEWIHAVIIRRVGKVPVPEWVIDEAIGLPPECFGM
jgi:hypothetical protein